MVPLLLRDVMVPELPTPVAPPLTLPLLFREPTVPELPTPTPFAPVPPMVPLMVTVPVEVAEEMGSAVPADESVPVMVVGRTASVTTKVLLTLVTVPISPPVPLTATESPL